MLNNVTVAGRLTKEIELFQAKSGKPVCSFTIACERDFRNQSGDRETDFIDCVVFGASAEFLRSYAEKGQLIMVSGRLQFRDWTDKNGNKRRNAEVMVGSVYLGDRRESKPKADIDHLEDKVSEFQEMDDEPGYLPF